MRINIKKIYLMLIGGLISILLDILIINSLKEYNNEIIISFIILNTLCLILFCLISMKDSWYFEANFLAFYMLFFLIAPIIQLKIEKFPTPMYIQNNLIIKANLINIIFILIYVIARILFEKKVKFTNKKFLVNRKTNKKYLIFFIVMFLITIKYFLGIVLYRKVDNTNSSSMNLIVHNFILCIPIYFIFYEFNENFNLKNGNRKKLFLALLLSLIIINPLIFTRNILGSVYLTIMVVVIKRLNASKVFIIIMLSMIFIFPLMANITHSKGGIADLTNSDFYFNSDMFVEQFKELHFDAWANLNTDIQMVNQGDIPLFRQFVGDALFFVPRKIWENKPLGSGQMTGNYLIRYYGFDYNNLSCPLTSELYISFRWIGIILGAIIFAYIGRKISIFILRNNFYKMIGVFVSFYNIFLMRGDLMNGFAYLSGVLVTIWIMPVIFQRLRNFLARK